MGQSDCRFRRANWTSARSAELDLEHRRRARAGEGERGLAVLGGEAADRLLGVLAEPGARQRHLGDVGGEDGGVQARSHGLVHAERDRIRLLAAGGGRAPDAQAPRAAAERVGERPRAQVVEVGRLAPPARVVGGDQVDGVAALLVIAGHQVRVIPHRDAQLAQALAQAVLDHRALAGRQVYPGDVGDHGHDRLQAIAPLAATRAACRGRDGGGGHGAGGVSALGPAAAAAAASGEKLRSSTRGRSTRMRSLPSAFAKALTKAVLMSST